MSKDYLEQLNQLKKLTWDGNLISKRDRDELYKKELIIKINGFNIISEKGIIYLYDLGLLNEEI